MRLLLITLLPAVAPAWLHDMPTPTLRNADAMRVDACTQLNPQLFTCDYGPGNSIGYHVTTTSPTCCAAVPETSYYNNNNNNNNIWGFQIVVGDLADLQIVANLWLLTTARVEALDLWSNQNQVPVGAMLEQTQTVWNTVTSSPQTSDNKWFISQTTFLAQSLCSLFSCTPTACSCSQSSQRVNNWLLGPIPTSANSWVTWCTVYGANSCIQLASTFSQYNTIYDAAWTNSVKITKCKSCTMGPTNPYTTAAITFNSCVGSAVAPGTTCDGTCTNAPTQVVTTTCMCDGTFSAIDSNIACATNPSTNCNATCGSSPVWTMNESNNTTTQTRIAHASCAIQTPGAQCAVTCDKTHGVSPPPAVCSCDGFWRVENLTACMDGNPAMSPTTTSQKYTSPSPTMLPTNSDANSTAAPSGNDGDGTTVKSPSTSTSQENWISALTTPLGICVLVALSLLFVICFSAGLLYGRRRRTSRAVMMANTIPTAIPVDVKNNNNATHHHHEPGSTSTERDLQVRDVALV